MQSTVMVSHHEAVFHYLQKLNPSVAAQLRSLYMKTETKSVVLETTLDAQIKTNSQLCNIMNKMKDQNERLSKKAIHYENKTGILSSKIEELQQEMKKMQEAQLKLSNKLDDKEKEFSLTQRNIDILNKHRAKLQEKSNSVNVFQDRTYVTTRVSVENDKRRRNKSSEDDDSINNNNNKNDSDKENDDSKLHLRTESQETDFTDFSAFSTGTMIVNHGRNNSYNSHNSCGDSTNHNSRNGVYTPSSHVSAITIPHSPYSRHSSDVARRIRMNNNQEAWTRNEISQSKKENENATRGSFPNSSNCCIYTEYGNGKWGLDERMEEYLNGIKVKNINDVNRDDVIPQIKRIFDLVNAAMMQVSKGLMSEMQEKEEECQRLRLSLKECKDETAKLIAQEKEKARIGGLKMIDFIKERCDAKDKEKKEMQLSYEEAIRELQDQVKETQSMADEIIGKHSKVKDELKDEEVENVSDLTICDGNTQFALNSSENVNIKEIERLKLELIEKEKSEMELKKEMNSLKESIEDLVKERKTRQDASGMSIDIALSQMNGIRIVTKSPANGRRRSIKCDRESESERNDENGENEGNEEKKGHHRGHVDNLSGASDCYELGTVPENNENESPTDTCKSGTIESISMAKRSDGGLSSNDSTPENEISYVAASSGAGPWGDRPAMLNFGHGPIKEMKKCQNERKHEKSRQSVDTLNSKELKKMVINKERKHNLDKLRINTSKNCTCEINNDENMNSSNYLNNKFLKKEVALVVSPVFKKDLSKHKKERSMKKWQRKRSKQVANEVPRIIDDEKEDIDEIGINSPLMGNESDSSHDSQKSLNSVSVNSVGKSDMELDGDVDINDCKVAVAVIDD